MGEENYKITPTLIEIPHTSSNIIFSYKKYRGNHKQVAYSIENDGLILPNQGQNISLFYFARKYSKEPEFKAIKKALGIFCSRFFSFTDIHYFPGGIRFYHDFSTLNKRLINPTKKQLESMLSSKQIGKVIFSDDGTLRMVQGKYPIGELKRGSLAHHPDIIGVTGSEEIADRTNELAILHKGSPALDAPRNPKPYLNLLPDVKKPITRYCVSSSNDSGPNMTHSSGLVIGGKCSHGNCGFAFGIQKELSDKVDEGK